jgi:putative hydrolase of the HAD superfamily
MPKRSIQAIIFDLGNTLMYAPNPWPPIVIQADRALADTLCAHGVEIDCDNFHTEFRQRLQTYYDQRDQDLYETSYLFVLRELLAEKGHPNLPEPVLRGALDALFTVTQANWLVEEDTHPTLAALEQAGYRLGIISNAGDNKDVFQLVDKFGIEGFFDFILTSAACGYRKPHPRIFELALAHWQLRPADIAMVGDTIEADIRGAQRFGMTSIWITRRCAPGTEKPVPAPDAVIPSLAELPQALENLYRG